MKGGGEDTCSVARFTGDFPPKIIELQDRIENFLKLPEAVAVAAAAAAVAALA